MGGNTLQTNCVEKTRLQVWSKKLGGKIGWKSQENDFFEKLCAKNDWKMEWKRSDEQLGDKFKGDFCGKMV